MSYRVAILTISTRGARGQRPDTSGAVLRQMVGQLDAEIIEARIIPDDHKQIVWELKRFCDNLHADLVLTTGGTGLSPHDVTPEATLEVIDRRVPGMEGAMLVRGLQSTPHAMLSRGVVGTRGKTLIINLPGSPQGAKESFQAVLPAIPHAIAILQDRMKSETEHQHPSSEGGAGE